MTVAIVLEGQVPFTEYKALNAGTVYQLAVIDHGELGIWLLFSSGFGGLNYGQWVHINHRAIAWSYITEKCPALANKGDEAGWIMALAGAGLDIF